MKGLGFITALLLPLVVLGWVPMLAFGGPSCTGCGGSTIQLSPDHKPVLLDLLSVESPEQVMASRKASEPGDFLHPAHRYDHNYVEIVKSAAFSRARALALKKIEQWESTSPALAVLLKTALAGLVGVTDSCFRQLPQYDLSPELPNRFPELRIQSPILYVPDYGPIVSLPKWNGLDLDTQAGLLIHEALRQVQNVFGYGINNKQLQILTGKIMTSKPKAGEALEDGVITETRLLDFLKGYRRLVIRQRQYRIVVCNALAQLAQAGSVSVPNCVLPPWTPTEAQTESLIDTIENRLHHPHDDFSLEHVRSFLRQGCGPGSYEYKKTWGPDLGMEKWDLWTNIEFMRCEISSVPESIKGICRNVLAQDPSDASDLSVNRQMASHFKVLSDQIHLLSRLDIASKKAGSRTAPQVHEFWKKLNDEKILGPCHTN